MRDIRRLGTKAYTKLRHYLYFLRMACRGVDLWGTDLRTISPTSLIFSSRTPSTAGWYESSWGPMLESALDTLSISQNDSILDIGCGKGAAMITMAQYPFGRIDGVEISPYLAEIAQRNLARLGINRSSIFCCNAADFQGFDPYTLLYMFNPFYRDVLERVLENVRVSLERCPRQLTVIYLYAKDDDLLIQAGFRRLRKLPHVLFPTVVYLAGPRLCRSVQAGSASGGI
jgi:SAM-dependent methyltransferase